MSRRISRPITEEEAIEWALAWNDIDVEGRYNVAEDAVFAFGAGGRGIEEFIRDEIKAAKNGQLTEWY